MRKAKIEGIAAKSFTGNISNRGRPSAFDDPEMLRIEADMYFMECDARKDWDEVQFVGKAGRREAVHKRVPYTWQGLCLYLGVNTKWYKDFPESEVYRNEPKFSEILAYIRDRIEGRLFEGAVVGHYNPMIAARILGLKDGVDVTSDGKALTPIVQVQHPEDAEAINNLADSL